MNCGKDLAVFPAVALFSISELFLGEPSEQPSGHCPHFTAEASGGQRDTGLGHDPSAGEPQSPPTVT